MGTEFCTAADCVGGGVDAEVEIGGELPLMKEVHMQFLHEPNQHQPSRSHCFHH